MLRLWMNGGRARTELSLRVNLTFCRDENAILIVISCLMRGTGDHTRVNFSLSDRLLTISNTTLVVRKRMCEDMLWSLRNRAFQVGGKSALYGH